jgi:hypothetical protein
MKSSSRCGSRPSAFYRDSSHVLGPSFAGRKLPTWCSVRYRCDNAGNDLVLGVHLPSLAESHFK